MDHVGLPVILDGGDELATLAERISALAGLAQSTTSDARREQYQEAM